LDFSNPHQMRMIVDCDFLLIPCQEFFQFPGLSLDRPIANETTLLNFRHLLEKHELCPRLLEAANHERQPEVQEPF